MMLWIIFSMAWSSGWFFQKWLATMDLCRSTHTTFLVSMATKMIHLWEAQWGQSREVFLVQSKMVHLRFKSPLQVSLGPDISGLNEPTQEMNHHIPIFFLRFCKRTNNLLKFSQNSINLGLMFWVSEVSHATNVCCSALFRSAFRKGLAEISIKSIMKGMNLQ